MKNPLFFSSREHLAQAYRLIALQQLDDHTYTHLSCRASEHSYYLAPFGLRFEEVYPDYLLEIDITTNDILSGQEKHINVTAYNTHSPFYKQNPKIGAIFHLHTPEIIAVSSHPQGLLPLSQWALHFYEHISYYNYDSLILSSHQSTQILQEAQNNRIIFMRHHGVIILGETVWEAFFYLHHLQKACMTQCLALRQHDTPLLCSELAARQAYRDLNSFENDLGWRDWCAWSRYLQRHEEKSLCSY